MRGSHHATLVPWLSAADGEHEIGTPGVEHLEHRKDLVVLRDPGRGPLGVQDDGLDVLVHAALADPPAPVIPKILVRASASSSSVNAPCSSW